MVNPYKDNERDAIPALTKRELGIIQFLKDTDVNLCYGKYISEQLNSPIDGIYSTLNQMIAKNYVKDKSIKIKTKNRLRRTSRRVYFLSGWGEMILRCYKILEDYKNSQ